MKKLAKLMAGTLCAMLGAVVAQAEKVSYLDYEPATKSFVMATNDCTLVTDTTRELADGWYAVKGNVVLKEEANVTVTGDAHLILCDGASLTIASPAGNSAAIAVGKSESLTIYGAANGTGRLEAIGGSWSAGIGADNRHSCGTVTINGGTVTATGYNQSAGIGGSTGNPAGGTVTINGGMVTARGGQAAAGIGGGYHGAGGTVTINGGAVTAQGGSGASDIGSGESGNAGFVQVTGGVFWAKPLDSWLPDHYDAVSNDDPATAADYPWTVKFNLVATVVLQKTVTHVNKYGEKTIEITGTETNEFASMSEAIAMAQVNSPYATAELQTNVNETVRVSGEGMAVLNLNGYTLAPSRGEDASLLLSGSNSNLVLCVMNGTLSGNLSLGDDNGEDPDEGAVMLGPNLVSDGDICVAGNVKCVLASGFKSTYEQPFSTRVPLIAMEGAMFAYNQNVDNGTVLTFQDPDLELVPMEEGGYKVGTVEIPICNKWSYDLTDWLVDIPDETPIEDICFPASHDSGMISGHIDHSCGFATILANNQYVTQSCDINEQLLGGVRVFDFRCRCIDKKNKNKFSAWHGPDDGDSWLGCKMGRELGTTLDHIRNFLIQHDREVVLLELSHHAEGNELSCAETQTKVIQYVLNHPVSNLMYRCEKADAPNLNEVALRDVRGKLVVLVEPRAGQENEIDPQKGIWGLKMAESPVGLPLQSGYLVTYDKYADKDTYDSMCEDQANKWKAHTEADKDKRLPFCLNWSLTAQYWPSIAAVAVELIGLVVALAACVILLFLAGKLIIGWIAIATLKSIGGTAVVMLLLSSLPLGVYFGGIKNVSIRKFANEVNPKLEAFLKDCHGNKGYSKPMVVSYDFIEEKYNRLIVDLNTNLVPYAAQIVDGVGQIVTNYPSLNDAFKDRHLLAENGRSSGHTVRLLRTEEPEQGEVFTVPSGTWFRFDLNGKPLRRAESNGGGPILVNNGTLEIVSTQPGGNFEGRGQLNNILQGSAIRNTADLTVKGVVFNGFKGFMGTGSVVCNNGRSLLLEDVVITNSTSACVWQNSGHMILKDCNLVTSDLGIPCVGTGGTVEMYDGHLVSDKNQAAVRVGGSCQFKMMSGEISHGKVSTEKSSKRDVNVIIYDGFIKYGKEKCLDGDYGTINVYGGCYGYRVDDGYIVNGRCDEVGTYPDYPFEIIPGSQKEGGKVARIVETQIIYPSVQDAIDAVARAGELQTIELLCPTHPVETLEFPKDVNAVLDLKGYRITKRGPEKPIIHNKGTLTITDSSEFGWGVITPFGWTNGCERAEAGGIVLNEGTFTLRGGTLCEATAKFGGAIYNATNGLCFIDGGTISSCQAYEDGGAICNRGVLVQRGGTIMECDAFRRGGGVWNGGSATFLDGEILSCWADSGGGIVNENEYALFGGVISNVTSVVGASAILANGISLTTLSGVSVKESIGQVTRWSPTAKIRIYEGLFGDYPERAWIQSGSKCVANEDATTNRDFPFRVLSEAVAQIGTRPYPTLQAAFDATCGESEVPVKLLKPVTRENVVLRDGCKAALDLAGLWVLSTKDALTVSTNAQLRIVDSVGGGKVGFLFPTNLAETCAVRNYGTCRIEAGRYNDLVLMMDSARTMSVKAGLFKYHPDNSWIDPGSRLKENDDPTTCLEYGFVVESQNVARFKDDPDGGERMTLARALRSEKLVGGGVLRTIQLVEDAVDVSVTVPAGRRAVLDLCGRWLRGRAHEPVITVEKGASLVIVDSAGGGLITKGTVHPQDRELRGAIANYGELELASGAVSNCFSYAEAGGVYNAKGAKFVMSGGRIVGCGMLEDTRRDRAAGVCNKGEFWMTGGEIVGCEAANGVMGVFNDEGAVFRQLGGRIEDCQNGAELGACVRNSGSYVLVDGRVADSNAGESNRVYCIDNSLQATSFVQAYGEVLANGAGYPIGSPSGARKTDFRLGNGKIKGVLHGSGGLVYGGFFSTDSIINGDWRFPRSLPDDIGCGCMLATNTDVVTKGDYPYCVEKEFEVILEHVYMPKPSQRRQYGAKTLKNAMSVEFLEELRRYNYRSIPGSVTIRLLADVKDCFECFVISNEFPEINITLDLNGFSLTGTGAKDSILGACYPVVENRAHLKIVDSSRNKTGFIAMSALCEPAQFGGGVCNFGHLEIEGVTIFGCRAGRGGGVFNAENGTLKMKNVRLLGCLSGGDAGGDCLFNAGDCELDDCELDLWPDARDPGNVRRGNAIVNTGSLRIPRGCRIRGGITNECDGVSGAISLSSGLFEQKPDDAWLEGAPDPKVVRLANYDVTTRIDYPWTIALGQTKRVDVVAVGGVEIKNIRAELRSGGEIVYSEELDLEVDESEAHEYHVLVPTGCSIIIDAVYKDETGHQHSSTREFSGYTSGFYLYKQNLFEVETHDDGAYRLYSTLDEALRSGDSTFTLISNASGSYHIPQGRKILVDLNGFTVGGTGTAPVFVNEGGLTIRDSSSRGTGRLTNGSEIKGLIECGGGVLNYGVFTLESGTIEDCIAGDFGGGIMGTEGSETYIRGGRIRNCRAEDGSAVYSRGHFKMSGGFVRDSMEFAELPPGAIGANADVTICGGYLGRPPDETLHLTPTAMLLDNKDDATRAEYPYQVVDFAASEAIYDVEKVTQTYFDTHSTILETNKIYRFVEDVTLTGSADDPDLASALAVTNGTTVLYIDEGVTVTLSGSVAEGQSGAGLRVSRSARVVIAGAGTLIAKGGGSTAGGDGTAGDSPLPTYRTTGPGGNGGRGGSGASAAIGGCGGFGGDGGKGGESTSSSRQPRAGGDGEDGSDGEDMGFVVVLGTVKIVATSDLESKSGGKSASGEAVLARGGFGCGGGGGGGGSGGLPSCAIGGGGGGGGGAGGGGAGGYKADATSYLEVVGVNGGCGRGGAHLGQDGIEADGPDLNEMSYWSCGGWGGSSGAAGLCGESDGFYAGDDVKIDCGGLYGSNFVARAIRQHGALSRQMIILDEDNVEICRVEACLDVPLPEITWALLGPKENIAGLFLVNGDASGEEMWYDCDLSPKKPRYEAADLGDVKLKVRYGTIRAILGKDTENERKFETLAAAVEEANYGDTISIIGDVEGENVKVPIGITIEVESGGKFRPPKEEDLRHKYYVVKKQEIEGGPTYYTYCLNEEMVIPKFGASDDVPVMEFVRDDEGKVMSVKLNVQNVYEDLYYILYWGLSPLPEEMVPVAWECADGDGTIRLEAPADENSGFYRIRVTDHIEGLLW